MAAGSCPIGSGRFNPRFCFSIDDDLGQFGQRLVGLLLFVEGRLKQLDSLVQPEFLCPGS